MPAPKTSSTSSFRGVLAGAIAAVAVGNLWVGLRLPALLQESSIDDVLELDRRVEMLPHKDRVSVLVLGNSHAIDCLRPPQLASVLGVQPDEVFNLAVAGSSPGEMRLLLERHLPRFPGVKRVVCGVDAAFLGIGTNYRTRYLTRFSPLERWRYALTWEKGLDDRLGTMAAMPFPAADFNGPLRDAFFADPGLAVRRLLKDEVKTGSHQALTSALSYPWGIPPERSRYFRHLVHMDGPPAPQEMLTAAKNTAAVAAGTGPGLEELKGLSDFLRQRELPATFVESPTNEALMAIVERVGRDRYAGYETRLAGFFASEGRPLTRSGRPWPVRFFYDQEHMTQAGAEAFSAWLRATWTKQRKQQPPPVGSGPRASWPAPGQ